MSFAPRSSAFSLLVPFCLGLLAALGLFSACAGDSSSPPAECRRYCDKSAECNGADKRSCLADCRDVAAVTEDLQEGCGDLYLAIQDCESTLTCDDFSSIPSPCDEHWLNFYEADCPDV